MGFLQKLVFNVHGHVTLDTIYLPTNQFRFGESFSYIFKYLADAEYQVEEALTWLRAKEWVHEVNDDTDGSGISTRSEHIREAYLFEDMNSQEPGLIGPDKPFNLKGVFRIPTDKAPSIPGCLEWTLEAKLTINGSSLIRYVPITVLPIIIVKEGDSNESPATSTMALTGRTLPPTYGPHKEIQ